jgi:mono/diheme cytochrome c family protein
MLTINLLKVGDAAGLIRSMTESSKSRGVREIGAQILAPRRSQGQGPSFLDTGSGPLDLTTEQRRTIMRGAAIYRELCATCHGADARGAPLAGAAGGTKMAPALAGSTRVLGNRDYIVNVLLAGLTGPIDGQTYAGGVMVPMGTNSDQWIADVSTFVRNGFGNRASFVTADHVAAARKGSARKRPWTVTELEAAISQASGKVPH